MMERPYYMDYSALRLMIHKVVTSKYFDLAISAVIGLNVITMAMEFYMMPKVSMIQSLSHNTIVRYHHVNRGMNSIEGKKTSVQCPLGRKLFNVKIALEMELVYDKNGV